jgi:hypothetical protein
VIMLVVALGYLLVAGEVQKAAIWFVMFVGLGTVTIVGGSAPRLR